MVAPGWRAPDRDTTEDLTAQIKSYLESPKTHTGIFGSRDHVAAIWTHHATVNRRSAHSTTVTEKPSRFGFLLVAYHHCAALGRQQVPDPDGFVFRARDKCSTVSAYNAVVESVGVAL